MTKTQSDQITNPSILFNVYGCTPPYSIEKLRDLNNNQANFLQEHTIYYQNNKLIQYIQIIITKDHKTPRLLFESYIKKYSAQCLIVPIFR